MVLLLMPVVSGLEIKEIMYNPVGNDNNLEYVELYSEEELNLSEYVFEDASSSDQLTLMVAQDSLYYLLVEEGFNASGLNASVYSAGATLGNNLNNDQDAVMVRDRFGEIVAVVSYVNTMGGNGNGMALCVNGTLYECVPTPGEDNLPLNTTTNTTTPPDNTTNSTFSVDYSRVHLSEVLPNPTGLDSDEMPDGEWVELYNEGGSLDMMGVEICDKGWKCVSIDSEHTLLGTALVERGYLVVYMNGASLLNNAGYEEVRLVWEGTVIDSMSYEGVGEGASWSLIDDAWKQVKPTPGEKNVHREQNGSVATGFSQLRLKDIGVGRDNKTRFGEIVHVRLWVYRGETDKQQIVVYAENVSEKLEVKVMEKFREYELVLPLKIVENCRGQYRDGWYTVVAEGLGLRVVEQIVINGSKEKCSWEGTYSVLSAGGVTESIINDSSRSSSEKLTGQVVYTSRGEKIHRYGLYGLVMVGVMLAGYFLLQR